MARTRDYSDSDNDALSDASSRLRSRIVPRKRTRRAVSYLEESDGNSGSDNDQNESRKELNGAKEPIVEDPADEDFEDINKEKSADESSDDDIRPSRSSRRKRQRSARPAGDGDDSDFKEDDVSDAGDEDEDDASGEEEINRLRDKQFVATDDEEGYSEYRSGDRRSRQRHSIKQHKRLKRADDELLGEDEEDDSIQQEIRDLYNSSPDTTPVKHKLREREKKIDYTIPSLLTNENENELYAQSVGPSLLFRARSRKPIGNKSEFRKLLYPTAGPFGGSDVVSILGQNIPPGGIPIPGMTGTAMTLNNESDSSDDDMMYTNTNTNALQAAPGATVPQNAGSANPLNILNHTNIRAAESVGKKKNTLSDTDPLGVDMNIDFSSVGGLENYIDQLKEMVALPLLYPELYQNFAITPPRGVLFHGPPGTGKTLMARALAASCSTPSRKITFFMRKGADCLSKWVGEAERQLRLLFEEAKNQQPSIIFFDEIDGLAPVRSSKQEQIHASIVSTLLALMDGMDNRGQVIVIGATNRPDSVDPALRRPGRFDREFYFPLPDINARKKILAIHTKKWKPPLKPIFVEKLAELTKGYGGADLRALCTEAALNSIQRKYPQIYLSQDKLLVEPKKVRVVAKDFMIALDKIVPSSARSSSTGSAPLPQRLQPLLQDSLDQIAERLDRIFPGSIGKRGQQKLTNLEQAMYLDPTVKDEDGGFSKQELLKNLENSRVCKPQLTISGMAGLGQQYLAAAILNLLEGFQVQNLDLASMYGDVTRSPELCIVQVFVEARRHQPSVILIPNLDIWYDVMPESAKALLLGLLRNLRSNEKVLFLGIAERPEHQISHIREELGFLSNRNHVELQHPLEALRKRFFQTIEDALLMRPNEFLNDLENRPKRKLKKLPIAPQQTSSDATSSKKQRKQQLYDDTKLKNVLKLKLAGMMDLFKNRYKRFKKAIIDDSLLHHLYDPSILQNPMLMYEVLYVKSTDPAHENMIQEVSTGKFFFNMDLDTIEERIWNGYYSEAKQFMKDIRMIVKDSITSGDRERILKANEMLTNAQFGIDDFNSPEFAQACRELRERELKKQEKLLADYEKLKEEFAAKQRELLQNVGEGNLSSGEDKVVPIADAEPEPANAGDTATLVENAEIAEGMEVDEIKPETETETGKIAENNGSSKVTDVKSLIHSNANGSISIRNGTTEEANGIVAEDTLENDAASESESEAEEESTSGPEKLFVVPPSTRELFETEMVEATHDFTIENLEQFVSSLMEIIWEDRSKWDKTETVERLRQAVDGMRKRKPQDLVL